MTTIATEPVFAPVPTTYDGLYLRPSLASKGDVPAAGPYERCPDIIACPAPVADPQAVFGTVASWGEMYDTEPIPGAPTYYYVRGLDGSAGKVSGTMSLYWAPAQLIMFPSAWKPHELSPETADVRYAAASGQIGVGDGAFVLPAAPALEAQEYVAFVAQAGDGDEPPPVPSITSWLDMSALLTQRLDIGFRNTCYVISSEDRWTRRVRFDVPARMPAGATLMLTISASGFVGATVGLLGDVFTADKGMMAIGPSDVDSDRFTMGTYITPQPGLEASFAVQMWRNQAKPNPGATLTVSVDYVIPQEQVAEAGARGLVHAERSRYLAETLGVEPKQLAPLGAASFIAA